MPNPFKSSPRGDRLTKEELAELAASDRFHDLGEDARQDVYLSALERPPRIERGLAAWFRGALRLRSLHIARREGSRLDRKSSAGLDDMGSDLDNPLQSLTIAETRERLIIEVMDLPQPYRTPLYLHYFEGLLVKDVAEHLNRPVSTIQTQLQRGLIMLRTRLEAAPDENGQSRSHWIALVLPSIPAPPAPKILGSTAALAGTALVAGGLVAGVFWHDWTPAKLDTEPVNMPFQSEITVADADTTGIDPAGPAPATQDSDPVGPAASIGIVESVVARSGASTFHLTVRSASNQQVLGDAYSSIPEATLPRIVLPVQGRGAAQADSKGSIELTGHPGGWVRVQAPGHLPATVVLPASRAIFEVVLPMAHTLTVRHASEHEHVQAKAWRVERHPIDLPPTPLIFDASANGVLTANLAAGSYIVSARDARTGQVDTAVVDLGNGIQTVWQAFDPGETTLEIAFNNPGHPPLGASLLFDGIEQPVGGQPYVEGQPMRFASLQAGDYVIVAFTGTGEIQRIPISVSAGQKRMQVTVTMGSSSLRTEVVGQGSASPEVFLTGPLERDPGLRRSQQSNTHFTNLRPGSYKAWTRTPGAIGMTPVKVQNSTAHVNLDPRSGATASLTYSGAPPLSRHEVVLVTESGVSLSLLHGMEFGSAATLNQTSTVQDPISAHGSVNTVLPPGDYRLLLSLDGTAFPERSLTLLAGDKIEISVPQHKPSQQIRLLQDLSPLAFQAVELSGYPTGMGPYSSRPGSFWMAQAVTDERGMAQVHLLPGSWTATMSGGHVMCFEVTADTETMTLDM